MQDLKDQLEKILKEAEDCSLIAKLATDKQKRDDFAQLSEKLRSMARDIETMIASKQARDDA